MTYCKTEFHLKGQTENTKAIFELFIPIESKAITREFDQDGLHVLYFEANCGRDISRAINNSWESVSKEYDCDIEAHSWNPEENWESFDVFSNGEQVTQEMGIWIENQCWDKDEFEDYTDFCEANDLDPVQIPEEDWVPDDEDDEECVEYYINEERGTIDFEFSF